MALLSYFTVSGFCPRCYFCTVTQSKLATPMQHLGLCNTLAPPVTYVMESRGMFQHFVRGM
jgi:hypothetical protein